MGDSLTVGETGFTSSVTDESVISYPKYLEARAQAYLHDHQSAVRVKVLNKGVNGDLTSGMLERFSRDVIDEAPDYVIVLGGTNDIGWGLDLAIIAHNLTSMYDAARDKGISAVACSVPSILGFDQLIPRRLKLNRTIRREAEKRKMPFLDLFATTVDPQSNRLSEGYSSDGLHLNSKGYVRVGEHIFEAWLKNVLDL